MPDPILHASHTFCETMDASDIYLSKDGDAAGVVPGGSGTTVGANFPAPGHPTAEWTANVVGTTPPLACTITEGASSEGGEGGG